MWRWMRRAYTFTIIAKTGDQNISAFGRDDGTEYVSINDSGHVAFIARVGSDQAIFVGNGNASPRMVTSEDGNPQSGFLYGPGLQLNNENRIIAVDRRIASGGTRYHLREWQPITWTWTGHGMGGRYCRSTAIRSSAISGYIWVFVAQ